MDMFLSTMHGASSCNIEIYRWLQVEAVDDVWEIFHMLYLIKEDISHLVLMN